MSPTAVPSPSPTMCPSVPTLDWRNNNLRYTRTIVAYDGVTTIETIALHLKQITVSGVTVEVSIDNGATWTPSESSERDDHFVTIKNKQAEIIHLQARLKNLCSQTSESLTQDIKTVPLPTGFISITNSPTITPSSPISRELVIGGTLLIVLIVAAFFVGA